MDAPLIRRAAERYVGRGPGWVGHYCLSYDQHYDATNVSFGALLACNEFVLEPGAGFGLHRHAGVDIVTVVLDGALTHVTPHSRDQQDSQLGDTGVSVVRSPDDHGSWEHDERNDGSAPVRFVQLFLAPGTDPWLHVLGPGQVERLVGPAFVYVTAGTVSVDGATLQPGDSLRSPSPVTVSCGPDGQALAVPC